MVLILVRLRAWQLDIVVAVVSPVAHASNWI